MSCLWFAIDRPSRPVHPAPPTEIESLSKSRASIRASVPEHLPVAQHRAFGVPDAGRDARAGPVGTG
jgi:hypothetical protein